MDRAVTLARIQALVQGKPFPENRDEADNAETA